MIRRPGLIAATLIATASLVSIASADPMQDMMERLGGGAPTVSGGGGGGGSAPTVGVGGSGSGGFADLLERLGVGKINGSTSSSGSQEDPILKKMIELKLQRPSIDTQNMVETQLQQNHQQQLQEMQKAVEGALQQVLSGMNR